MEGKLIIGKHVKGRRSYSIIKVGGKLMLGKHAEGMEGKQVLSSIVLIFIYVEIMVVIGA